jgi:anti-sigma factor RsiW
MVACAPHEDEIVNCTRLRQVLDAYLDGELDSATQGEISHHLAQCPACTALRGEREVLKQRVRADAPYFAAPEALKRAVHRSLAATAPEGAPRGGSRPSWLQAGVLAVAAALISALASYWLARPLPENPLREQVVASHIASLGPARPLADITSLDQHAIKPWFQGKLDFAPVVRDLSGQGFTLVGARLDHIADRQAAAIVYRVRNHPINLFVWRAADSRPETLNVSTVRGFGIATWAEGGLRFAAVSDADQRDLERFAELVRAQP